MPAKGSETFGGYQDWAYELFLDKCENIIERWSMREFYNERKEPVPDSFDSCPGEPSDYVDAQ